MAYSIRQINDAVHSDPRGFVQESDEAYNQKIEAAARKIADNLSKSRIVLLSGPSGSGKTTTAKKIEAKLTEMGINSHAVAMDNYFKTVDLETAPRNREGQIDYESPFCMDMDLLNQHFAALDRGERILIPKFEFARQMRSDIKSQPLQLGRDEIAIFEGIHALNDIITGRNPAAAKVYISARSDFLGDGGEVAFKRTWLRLERRTVRDAKFRAWKADVTVRMWATSGGARSCISPPSRTTPASCSTAPCPMRSASSAPSPSLCSTTCGSPRTWIGTRRSTSWPPPIPCSIFSTSPSSPPTP